MNRTASTNLYKQVSEALNGTISKQLVTNAGKSGMERPDGTKANSKSGMAKSKFSQKGNPNKTYSVEAINKAKAKLG